MTEAATLKNVKKTVRTGFLGARKEILSGVSLSVNEGTIHAFVGHNGAGKSTSFRILLGATAPDRGATVALFGGPPERARARVGYASDIPALPATLTPLEILHLHAALRGTALGPAAALALLERLGIGYVAKTTVRGFSKGMMQRLNLAQALLGGPDLLVLDEPMSGLDPAGRNDVRRLIQEEQARGATIILATHVLSDVEALCNDLTVLRQGKTVFAGAVAEALQTGRRGASVTFTAVRPAATPPPGFAVDVAGERVVVEADLGVDLGAMILAFQEAGYRLSLVNERHGSLEDVVAALTRTERAQ